MDKIEHKAFIEGKEVLKIAENYSTRIYQSLEDINIFYIANYDDVIATINLAGSDMYIEANYRTNTIQ